ncbi:MAG: nuclear transport factor 2 family protein [Bacteroidetes bacterium]|nr:MAG: nuclear transport factor 2 family protein [Bacteroidota bacterium]
MTNTELVNKFYTAFQQNNAEEMISCYHDEVEFSDPAFGELHGEKAKNMWKMLCQNSNELKIEFSDVESDEYSGSAQWQASYSFGKTGRKVHNVINARFEFKDEKIIKHTDTFNLRKWAGQAMGFKGYLFGWTFFFRKNLQLQTNYMLDKYIQSN